MVCTIKDRFLRFSHANTEIRTNTELAYLQNMTAEQLYAWPDGD
jgi:hypothetical protein